MNRQPADLILHNGKIATQDDRRSLAEAAAIRDGRFLAVGTDREVMRFRDGRTKLIDLDQRTVVPGLNDSHLHLIRGGLNYNMELRWDGVPSLADRIAALGGGIAIQHRMAFQGEYFRDRYGKDETKRTPPIREMLRTGLPVGAGTDATRVATYNPFVSLYWLITGKTVGRLSMYTDDNRLDRMEALRLWTVGSSWFSTEQDAKGSIVAGQLADLAVLSADYFLVPDEEIKGLESVLTIVGGKPVYAAEEFADLAPPLPPVLPEWSPVAAYGGYFKPVPTPVAARSALMHSHRCEHHRNERQIGGGMGCLCWAF